MERQALRAISAGNVAVVTGAASGIGLATAKQFAALGLRVCLVDKSDAVVGVAAGIGGDAAGFVVDVGDRAAVQTLAADVRKRFGPVAVLMNNAAISGGADALSAPEIWEDRKSVV